MFKKELMLKLPRWIVRRKDLTPSSKFIYGLLYQRSKRRRGKRECKVFTEDIAYQLFITERHVRKCIGEMFDQGILDIEITSKPSRKKKIYLLK